MNELTNKKMLIFPGQGSQYAKMPCNTRILECGSDILGYDLRTVTEDAEKLADTRYAQPAIFAASLSSYENYTGENYTGSPAEFGGVSGHSLGEYAALVCCGVLSMEDGFRALAARGRIMSEAGEAVPGGMTAVVANSEFRIPNSVLGICSEYRIWIANCNSPMQSVIAGELPALEQAEERLKACGEAKGVRLKLIRLKVSAAFHTPLMNPASREFAEVAAKLTFSPPKTPFYSNVTGDRLNEVNADYLARHMVSPVLFVQQLRQIQADGYDEFVELAPGKVLSGLVRKTLDGVTVTAVDGNS
jgi:[acyl-carrier-protein] S-malonyltransferase